MNIDRSLLKNYADTETAGAPPLPPDSRRPIAADQFSTPTRPSSQPAFAPQPTVETPSQPAPRPAQPAFKPEPKPKPQPVQPATPKGDTNISINITMPKIKKPTLPDWNWRKIGIRAGVVVGLIVLSLVVRGIVVAVINHNKENAAKHRIDMLDKRKVPTFKPVVPKGSAAAAKTAAYDPHRDSYSYSDTLKGLSLVVSQQRLPAGATPDTIAKIAKSMNATTPIVSSKGTAYLASNPTGAQTVVLGTSSLLVFVQSAFAHSNDDWKSYLDTLQS